MKSNRIVFFYPSYDLGGVQTLFIRVASELRLGRKVLVFDFPNGCLSSNLKGMDNLEIVDPRYKYPLKPGDLVITSFNFVNLIHFFFEGDCRFLFWCLSPFNFPLLNVKRKSKLLNKVVASSFMLNNYDGIDVFKASINSKSVFFMDRYMYEYNGSPTVDYDPFLPLFIDADDSTANYDVSRETLNFAWLGRIDKSIKYHCLRFLFESFLEYKNSTLDNCNLTVIGDGSGRKELIEYCNYLGISNDVKFIKEVSYKALPGYLLSSYDLIFAHGTSCLESAKLAIPTICLDGNMEKMPEDYKYKWLFERPSYDVGRVSFSADFSIDGDSFLEVVRKLKYDRENLSKKSRKVVIEQYSKRSFFNKLSDNIESIQVTAHKNVNVFTYAFDFVVHYRLLVNYLKSKVASVLSKMPGIN